MIIACPACGTRYDVPESSIGDAGRTVRCAKCREPWFQEPAMVPGEAHADAPDVGEAAPAPVAACADISEPPAPAPFEAVAEPRYPSASPLPEGDDKPPRRRRWGVLAIWALVVALLALAIAAAVYRYGLPDWVPGTRPTIARAEQGLVLDFPRDRLDRRTLPDGTEFFGARGTITNVGRARREVPSLMIVLRDRRRQVVYSWEVVPPKRSLAPGESMTINEAVTDVPKSAIVPEIGWKPA